MLRDYQEKLKNGIYAAWQEWVPTDTQKFCNVLAVAPTGAGKTKIKGRLFAENPNYPACAIAHRQELVTQISCAMADADVYHRIIGPKEVVAFCITRHIKLFGKSFHHPNAPIAVAGIDTLLRRAEVLQQWMNQVRIWDIDEAHHVLRGNKWGKGAELFPNAWGVGFTATPVRSDRKSLGRARSGIFDKMVIGPTPRELIDRGFLSDFIIYAPPPSIDLTNVPVTGSGEFEQTALRNASHESKIVGDIVEHYLKLAPGKRGITFTVDVQDAVNVAAAFRQKGVPAESVSGKTPETLRTTIMEKFERGELKQVTNCDLFGEGLDVPGVEVVSKGRPTMSLGLDRQQDGRALRPVYASWLKDPNNATDAERLQAIATGPKPKAIIIDHVNNIVRHKPLDTVRAWSLDDDESGRKKKDRDEIPITPCVACFRPYEAFRSRCPHCGHKPEPMGRAMPEQVAGDLVEYSPELLAMLRRQAEAAMQPFDSNLRTPADVIIKRNMEARIEAQKELRDCIALWAGIQREVHDRPDSDSYRLFYYTFGIDVLTAQTLGRPEAEKLTKQIRDTFT